VTKDSASTPPSAKNWREALEIAYKLSGDCEELRLLATTFPDPNIDGIWDIFRTELRSILFDGIACEQLLAAIAANLPSSKSRVRNSDSIYNGLAQSLCFPFASDATLSCFNAYKITKAPEFVDLVGQTVANCLSGELENSFPRIVDASDAVRHHHDRVFGRFREMANGDAGQRIVVFGAEIHLLDQSMKKFSFGFGSKQLKLYCTKAAVIMRSQSACRPV
jgi:hypothetical protein